MKTKTRPFIFCGSACTPATGRACAAFTLFELLAVISIVSILSAILIPITAKVRTSARASHCVSNLRQVGSAFHLYAQEHQQKYPAPKNALNDDYWFEALQSYSGSDADLSPMDRSRLSQAFICPEWKRNELDWAGGEYDIGYAMSTALSGLGDENKEVLIDQITIPTQTVLVLENPSQSTPFFPGTGEPVSSIVAPYFNLQQNLPTGTGRHEHRANYLFADGHVKGCTVDEGRALFDAD